MTGSYLTFATRRLAAAGDAEFVRTAFGKGLSERRVAIRHTLPAAAGPTISFAGAYTPLLVGNALLVEQVFNIPGVFRYTRARSPTATSRSCRG
jgi:ABC-type dipeptide/oligopeptide/nickel transport system permease component